MSADLQRSFAMFRFNFWPKPFFAPIPGTGGMDNPSFVPNPLTSPALMVLASTASGEGHEASRLPVPPHHPFSGHQPVDKDLPPPPFSSAGLAMYRPGDPFPSPLYSPLSLMRPGMDQRLAMMNPAVRAGAFRPLGASTADGGPEGSSYHSAFSPAKKVKSEESAASYSSDHHGGGGGHRGGDAFREGSADRDDVTSPPEMKEERPSSLSSAGCDTISEPLSDSERGTPDSDGRALRKQRKRPILDGQAPCCPICGLTLRSGELEVHLMLEIDKLDKLNRGGRKSRDTTPQGRKSLPSPSGSRKGKDSPTPELASRARYDNFLRIRCNRQSRLSSRSRNKKRRPGEDGMKETLCPICNERLTGPPEELNAHVEMCLKQRSEDGGGGGVEEDEAVDVEGEYEEYEWAGQTRVRATSMLQGGFAASGFQTVNTKRNVVDEDAELNVDGDDSDEYGKPQFSQSDILPLEVENADTSIPSTSAGFLSRTDATINSDDRFRQHCDELGSHDSSEVVSALKLKLRDLEDIKIEKQKCLICMESYKTPLTSIQCWHVHCQDCWMKTLGVKKLCPQCNMITAPSNLRRIFL